MPAVATHAPAQSCLVLYATCCSVQRWHRRCCRLDARWACRFLCVLCLPYPNLPEAFPSAAPAMPAERTAVGGGARQLGGAGAAGHHGGCSGRLCCRRCLAVRTAAVCATARAPRLLRAGFTDRGAAAGTGACRLGATRPCLGLGGTSQGSLPAAGCLSAASAWVGSPRQMPAHAPPVFWPLPHPAALPGGPVQSAADRGAPGGRLGRLRRRAAVHAAQLPRAAQRLAGVSATRARWVPRACWRVLAPPPPPTGAPPYWAPDPNCHLH